MTLEVPVQRKRVQRITMTQWVKDEPWQGRIVFDDNSEYRVEAASHHGLWAKILSLELKELTDEQGGADL